MRAVPVLLIASIASSGAAAAIAAEDAIETSRHVIEDQIKAFLNDDAAAAYAFAAPDIKAKFPDKDVFFAMVKKSYEPVYHPRDYAFGRSKSIGDGAMILHEVLITGRDGRNWRAVYKLMRQPDGSYKIGGVAVVPDMISKDI
jgi:ketosteroid isomerase-like protein